MSNSSQDGYYGYARSGESLSDFGAVSFLVSQILDGRNTATLVQVKAVTNSGGVTPVGMVDILPLVNQLDGEGKAVPHQVVRRLPYFRLQGGANAVILDPQVGDIGIAVFADRDISSVKAAKGRANPGSARRSNKADGLYIGGFLNAAPSQYIQFASDGINIVSPMKVTIQAPDVEIQGNSLTHNGVNIGSTHKHGGVVPGGGDTSSPH